MRDFECGELHYIFGENGFPAEIRLGAVLHHHNLLKQPINLTLTLGDGRTLHPAAGAKTECLTRKKGAAQIIEFNHLALTDAAGNAEPGLLLCLRYELYDDIYTCIKITLKDCPEKFNQCENGYKRTFL